ncbi:MAG: class I SAM-dependent methyltransferase [Planctomycetota bacterium]
MKPKPRHLGPEHGSVFSARSVVEAYRHRPPYPPETFDILADLAIEPGGAVLDAGCGTGLLARLLAMRGFRVDGVDPSAAMLEVGRRLEGGDRVNWIEAPMESAPLEPPYALATAGESLHWMEWSVVLPRIAEALLPGARLVVVGKEFDPSPWADELAGLVARFTTNPDLKSLDLAEELASRGLFAPEGEVRTGTVRFDSRVEDYVESFHSTSYLSRERMAPEDAAAFDAEVRRLVYDAHPGGRFTSEVRARIAWGEPLTSLSGPTSPRTTR